METNVYYPSDTDDSDYNPDEGKCAISLFKMKVGEVAHNFQNFWISSYSNGGL
jgi:hypothetical protein